MKTLSTVTCLILSIVATSCSKQKAPAQILAPIALPLNALPASADFKKQVADYQAKADEAQKILDTFNKSKDGKHLQELQFQTKGMQDQIISEFPKNPIAPNGYTYRPDLGAFLPNPPIPSAVLPTPDKTTKK